MKVTKLKAFTVIALAGAGSLAAQEQDLILANGPVVAAQLAEDPMVVRQQEVWVQQNLLLDASVERLRLQLHDRPAITALRTWMEPAYGGGVVWEGTIEGDPTSSVTFSMMQEATVGAIRYQGRLYRLGILASGNILSELDESQAPPCGTGPEHHVGHGQTGPEDLGQSGGGNTRASAQGATIDVLVAYTTQAKNGQGGTSAIEALINQAISETNSAYSQSQVDQRLRLVHMAEMVGYTETGNFGTELSRLRSTSDGHMDEVHSLRNQYGADAVALIVNGTQYCGIAYLMTNVSSSFASSAFSVTSRVCATGYYTFGHELGHNFGCAHDRQNASSGAYAYSFGYRTPNNAYRTIMAYSPGSRIRRHSNPNITFAGFPLGIAHPSSNSAENWMSLNNAAPTTSQWRGPADIVLEVEPLIAGQTGTACLSNCNDNQAVVFSYSLTGAGPTNTQYGLMDLSAPIRSFFATSDNLGNAVLTTTVPLSASGRSIWIQGVDTQNNVLSNLVTTFIL